MKNKVPVLKKNVEKKNGKKRKHAVDLDEVMILSVPVRVLSHSLNPLISFPSPPHERRSLSSRTDRTICIN